MDCTAAALLTLSRMESVYSLIPEDLKAWVRRDLPRVSWRSMWDATIAGEGGRGTVEGRSCLAIEGVRASAREASLAAL